MKRSLKYACANLNRGVYDVADLVQQSVGCRTPLLWRLLLRFGEAEADGHVEDVSGRKFELKLCAVHVRHGRSEEGVLRCNESPEIAQ